MLFHKPLSEMTNQEINTLLAHGGDIINDLITELDMLKLRRLKLTEELEKRVEHE
jgi:hypothetical protein